MMIRSTFQKLRQTETGGSKRAASRQSYVGTRVENSGGSFSPCFHVDRR